MLQTVTYRGPSNLLGGVRADDFVKYGPAGAIWRVATYVQVGADATLTLEAADPHDVPFFARVLELPMLDRSV